jgi:hypothetical protein
MYVLYVYMHNKNTHTYIYTYIHTCAHQRVFPASVPAYVIHVCTHKYTHNTNTHTYTYTHTRESFLHLMDHFPSMSFMHAHTNIHTHTHSRESFLHLTEQFPSMSCIYTHIHTIQTHTHTPGSLSCSSWSNSHPWSKS